MTPITNHGSKHTCASCATRFYDLKKSPAICPKCHHRVVSIKAPVRKKRRSAGDSTPEERNAAQHVVIATPKPKPVKWNTRHSK